MTLQANVAFFVTDDAVVTITGLLCDGASCLECNGDLTLEYTLPTAGVDVYHAPTYSADGSLLLDVIADIAYNQTVVFSFCLVNPLLGQFSPAMAISGSGVDFLPAAMRPAAASGAPLSVLGFESASIVQSNPAQDTPNTLTASLMLYASVAAGYSLQFSNLTGVSSASGNRAVSGGGYFAPLGSWDASAQIFTVFVERDMPFGVEVAVQFTLTNGVVQQDSPAVSVAVLDAAAAPIIQTGMTTGVGNAAVLTIAGFSRSSIQQVRPTLYLSHIPFLTYSLSLSHTHTPSLSLSHSLSHTLTLPPCAVVRRPRVPQHPHGLVRVGRAAPGPQTLNPKHSTLNPEPYTLNPRP